MSITLEAPEMNFVQNPETKSIIPAPIRKGVQRFADFYFGPLPFERNPKIYEYLGVKFFKTILPNGGNLVNRRKLKMEWNYDTKNLRSAQTWGKGITGTKLIEVLHLGMAALYGGMFIPDLQQGEYIPDFIAMQVVFNVYPILLQRYNRARATRLLAKYK